MRTAPRHSAYSDLSGLHLLRFLLTLSILIVHFPHFLFPFGTSHSPASLPFATVLAPIYAYGGFAVEVFWMISGVIFHVFYMEEIHERRISFRTFLGLRLTRLYPLHIATLLTVALLQWQYQRIHGNTFIYQNNDATHFVLNVFMISFWNAKFGLSFNGPFWSVSVEMFVYFVFFLLALLGLLRTSSSMARITVLSFACYALGIFSPFYECLLYFFAGTWLAKDLRHLTSRRMLLILALIVGALALRQAFPVLRQHFELKRIVDTLVKLGVSTLIVAGFMRFLAHPSDRLHRVFMELGNLTYSVYMIHISLQITLVLLLQGMGESFFNTRIFFLSYLAAALALGYVIYRWYEVPAQTVLRSLMMRRAAA